MQYERQGAHLNWQASHDSPARTEQLYRTAELKALTIQATAEPIRDDLDRLALSNDLSLLSAAVRELERRAFRMRHLPAELLPDGGWTILLDLFICEQQANTIWLAGNADRWNLSEATAARHIAALIATNLAMRVFSKTDDEPATLRLTRQGRDILKRVLSHHE